MVPRTFILNLSSKRTISPSRQARTEEKDLQIQVGRVYQTHYKDLDLYAFAIVIHVWQIVCVRMQHGELPSKEVGISLTLGWMSYFLSAYNLVEQHIRVAQEEVRFAVQHWENRLRDVGCGNQWITNRWAENISTVDQDVVFHRNETADRYLKALDKLGKEGLAIAIIEEENKSEPTQLRTTSQEPPEGMDFARRQIASMWYSMDTSLLKAAPERLKSSTEKAFSRAFHLSSASCSHFLLALFSFPCQNSTLSSIDTLRRQIENSTIYLTYYQHWLYSSHSRAYSLQVLFH